MGRKILELALSHSKALPDQDRNTRILHLTPTGLESS
jgi:hypothetical protein